MKAVCLIIIYACLVSVFGINLSLKADPEVQNENRVHENNNAGEREHSNIIEQIMKAEVKVPKPDEVTPEDFCDENPDHYYFYDPRNRRWFWVTEDEPRDKHWAPFDYDAGTGKYIECEGDKWYSFAPVYNGKRVQIYTDEELGITTEIEEASDREGADSGVVEAPVPEALSPVLTEEADTESLAENMTESVIEQELEETSSIESANVPEISAEEDKSENVKSEEVREGNLTAAETRIIKIPVKKETFKEPPTAETEKKAVINQEKLVLFTPEEADKFRHTTVEELRDTEKLNPIMRLRSAPKGPYICINEPPLTYTDGVQTILVLKQLHPNLLVKFEENQAPVNMKSLQIKGKKGIFSKSITDRFIPYIKGTTIEAEDMEMRNGNFILQVKIADVNNNKTDENYRLIVKDK